MVHWSHFAGSLWDNVLAAHVHLDNIPDKVLSFEAAIDEFVTNTFIGIGEHWSAYPCRRSQYVRMCFNNLRLMARRATGSSLQLEGRISAQLQVAVTSIAHARCQGWDTNDAYLLRHRMVTTLAASLHLLCSALVGNQQPVAVVSSISMSLCKAEFDAAVDLLLALAQGVTLAQRVLRDFDRIFPVIRGALTRWSEESSSFESRADWTITNDVIPPNAAEFLPYKEQIPNICYLTIRKGMWATNGSYLETDCGLSDWNTDLEPGGARSSVLWV
ncbi:uncharacterized protein M421DRAFT_352798 [Didymella exigua CBS 183.55]|uniref:Uncharacterized protein n=1 Tax=Didymella exigua CBS 183.55 TaxID=1150837 RepID=A0A6A5R3F5_9PLEO|nr:uncharacterized protein M421DRAFT_352798 [Didymella exigua CBS 183.55]KAF1922591.1 hypothetical protein M421DRAFT_352798 [Didymella exigua CBS 183.55]